MSDPIVDAKTAERLREARKRCRFQERQLAALREQNRLLKESNAKLFSYIFEENGLIEKQLVGSEVGCLLHQAMRGAHYV